jgi:hypothetical protein
MTYLGENETSPYVVERLEEGTGVWRSGSVAVTDECSQPRSGGELAFVSGVGGNVAFHYAKRGEVCY